MRLSPTGRSALAYLTRFGWSVGPTEPGTKLPYRRLLAHGHLDATRDPEQIRRWWTAAPEAGVFISCAASGLVVIDRDTYKPECEFGRLQRELGPLPQTPRVLTQRGGEHYYFRDEGCVYSNPCPGVEAKHQGYVLAPCTPGYRWDVGAHLLDTPIARLPDSWLHRLTSKIQGSDDYLEKPSSGIDAADSWLGHAFAALGWLGAVHPDGKRNVRCPWVDEHSDGRGDGTDSSTALFPRAVGATLGGFACMHSHCAGRTWRDVVDVLPPAARWAADRAMRATRNRLALERLEEIRRAS